MVVGEGGSRHLSSCHLTAAATACSADMFFMSLECEVVVK